MRFSSALATVALSLSLIQGVLLTGCAGKGIADGDPAALYKEAEQDIGNDRYQLAIDKLRVIKNKYPYSKYAVDAQLKLADVYFLQESFGEAAIAYQSFADLHPKHERVSYALFRVGLSHFKDIPSTIARDMTPAKKALDAFEIFIRRFPSAPESQEAREKADQTRQMLANKELMIADFYYKRDVWGSAKERFEKILETYPETDAAKEAQKKLPLAEKALAKEQAAAEDGK